MAGIDLYCNWCGERFHAEDNSQRFCERGCSGAFTGAYRLANPLGRPVRFQARVLDALRAAPGQWLTTQYLAVNLWGADDASTYRAVYHAVRRLKDIWSSDGLVIESARWGNEPYRYRLVRDIPRDVAVAS